MKRYGVDVTDEFLIQLPRQQSDPRTIISSSFKRTSENPLALQFLGRPFIMRQSARVIKPAEGGGFKANILSPVTVTKNLDNWYKIKKELFN